MNSLLSPDQFWGLFAVIVCGVALSLFLEQRFKWAARLSGPVLALVAAMILSNMAIMPVESPTYDLIDNYLVPLAIPLLLFRANIARIVRDTGSMFLAFHVAAFGTLVGAGLAATLFRSSFDRVPEVTGIMTGSYIGGGVNFMAVKNSFNVPSELSNPLIVADNFIMAGVFVLLLILSGTRFLLSRYPHPHTADASGSNAGSGSQAAQYWERKGISLLDLAKALAVAATITALAVAISGAVKARSEGALIQAFFGNTFVWITFLTVTAASAGHRWMDRIHGAEELGTLMLYLFFFVIGLRADLMAVMANTPMLFAFCLVMALTNLAVTLLLGRWLRLNLEELLLCVNATLGGAPSAAAMAISKGWTKLVLPGLLVGIWGYVIGTFLGVLTGETLRRFLN